MAIDNTLLVWLIAAFIAIATPLFGYLSPFGRARRGLVSDLQKDLEILIKRVDGLKQDVATLTEQHRECEIARARLERENYRLYRELDSKRLG